jgi:hypothetical protein
MLTLKVGPTPPRTSDLKVAWCAALVDAALEWAVGIVEHWFVSRKLTRGDALLTSRSKDQTVPAR